MKMTLLSLAVITVLTGCATGSSIRQKVTGNQFDEPQIEQSILLKKDQYKVAPPEGGPIAVAVYQFMDKTGQRKSTQNIASLSSAVTQGAEGYLIKALQDAGDARWFVVLERVGLENLIKERQMIRQMREQYQGKDAKPLPPMMFAGVIVEGAIVGYDSNTVTGGSGVRLLGIGATTQYQSDTVTVVLRTVSVGTGEVLTSVTVTKTVLSYMDKFGVLKFVEQGTQAVEAETGASINESINKATNLAIQAAVVGTIREGARKGHWAFKVDKKEEPVLPVKPADTIAPATKVEEEKKNELVQKDVASKESSAAVPVLSGTNGTENSTGTSNLVDGSGNTIRSGNYGNTQTANNQSQTATVIDWVNLRSDVNQTSDKILKLKPDTKVEILNEVGEHYFIRHDGKEGWVAKKFIKVQK